jgi:hypothetical protein
VIVAISDSTKKEKVCWRSRTREHYSSQILGSADIAIPYRL